MKASHILLALSLIAPTAFAAQPTLESLALKVEVLERKIEALQARLEVAGNQKDANPAPEKAAPEIVIHIQKDGTFRLDDMEVGDEELAAKIEPIMKKFPDQPIRIKADGQVKYQIVVNLIALCQRAGAWNLSFASDKPK